MQTFFRLHMEGGPEFMTPLSLILITNLAVIIYVLLNFKQKKQIHSFWLRAPKQLGGLALAYGAFSSMFGLVQAFNAIEGSQEIIPIQVIMGGLKVASLPIIYGLIIFILSLTSHILLRWINRNSSAVI
jgi:hypothetical protein